MFEIRPARFMDAVLLAPELRAEDAQEIRLVWSVETLQGLFFSLLNSDLACALCVGGRPVALWGVSSTRVSGLDLGVPWMLGSRLLFERRRDLVNQSRSWVDRLLLDCDVLSNVTDRTNTAHLRWLVWCGFRPLREHERYGPYRRPFQEFYRVNGRRHPEEDAVRSLLLRRPPPRPLALPDGLRRLLDELAAVLVTPAAVAPGPFTAVDAGELMQYPYRWRRNLLALLVEAARRVALEPAPARPSGGDAGRCAVALADTADVARLADRDAPGLLAEMSACVAGGARAPDAAVSEAQTSPLVRLVGAYWHALTLGQQVAPVQGLRLWEAALGVDGAAPVWGVRRVQLHAALREHHLAAGWQAAASAPLIARGAVLERLQGAWHSWPPLGGALQRVLAEHPPELPQTMPQSGVVMVAGALADQVARQLVPLPRVGPVSIGYADRHGLYRLLRVNLLHVLGVPEDVLSALVIDDLSALLTVAAFEDALLGPAAPGDLSDRLHFLGDAVQDTWGGGQQAGRAAVDLLSLLAPGLVCPAVAIAQLPGALLAWHLLETAATDDVLQRVSDGFASPEREPRRRLARCLRDAARGLAMVDLQSHLDRHVHRSATVASGSARVAGPR